MKLKWFTSGNVVSRFLKLVPIQKNKNHSKARADLDMQPAPVKIVSNSGVQPREE